MQDKKTLWVILIALGIVTFAYAGYAAYVRPNDKVPQDGITPPAVVCTMDAMECPDGSYVGRQGPDCSFTPCPSPKPPSGPSDVICTTDVKECPDGSFVSRKGPDCSFAECPGPTAVTSPKLQ